MEYLGQAAAPLNSEDVLQTTVEPGSTWTGTPWLDAAITVSRLPGSEASRAPAAIRAVFEQSGADVDKAAWGGGGGAGGAAAGTIYLRWRPDKPYNAVDYANVARRLVARAAEGFPSGTRFLLNRYRIDGITHDLYVYPVLNRPLPPSAPPAARGTVAGDLPAPHIPDGNSEADAASGLGTTARVLIGSAGAAAAGLAGWFWWRGRGRSGSRRRTSRR